MVRKSLDGTTWGSPVQIYHSPDGTNYMSYPSGAVRDDGSVLVAYFDGMLDVRTATFTDDMVP